MELRDAIHEGVLRKSMAEEQKRYGKLLTEFNLYCDDEYIGTYTLKELADRFKISEARVLDYAEKKKVFKIHYRWTKLYNANVVENKYISPEMKALFEEWDRVTGPYRKRK